MLNALLILIFCRPFISSLAFPILNSVFSSIFLVILFFFLSAKFKECPLKKNPYFYFLLYIFCFSFAISSLGAENKKLVILELYKYITGFLLLICGASLNKKEKDKLIQTLFLSAVVISLAGIYQFSFGFRHLTNYIAQKEISNDFIIDFVSRKRIFFPFATPNMLAGFLAPIILLEANSIKKLGMIIILIALFLTQSLAGLLSLIVGVLVYLYFSVEKKHKSWIYIFILIIGLTSLFLIRYSSSKEHLRPDFSGLMRLNYWRQTINVIKDHPFFGVGAGNLNLYRARFTHNSYLQIWAELGVGAVISFAGLIWLGLKKVKIRIFREERQAKAILSASTVFLFHNLFDSTFFFPETNFLWWLLWGMLLGMN